MKRKLKIRKAVDEYLKQDVERKKVNKKQRKLLIEIIKQIMIFLSNKEVVGLIRNILAASLIAWILWYEIKSVAKQKSDDEYLLKFQYHTQEKE